MTSHVEIIDVEYVDDTMCAVRANTPAELNGKIDRLLTLVENFGPGKTECTIQCRS